ncbi:hypothetical protein CEXT_271601 [Caerostris extrusa]|uniref:Uncharacterized protein n=1 Tax=Caerostris extrusa TaxID=172846 RepID=A0AAV4MXP5_CAEEX|nr:hypothetical protein CEXT_271601 [Caerostris extrusa]
MATKFYTPNEYCVNNRCNILKAADIMKVVIFDIMIGEKGRAPSKGVYGVAKAECGPLITVVITTPRACAVLALQRVTDRADRPFAKDALNSSG